MPRDRERSGADLVLLVAMGADLGILQYAAIALFLFLAVWIPCCTSDIVFPLLFTKK